MKKYLFIVLLVGFSNGEDVYPYFLGTDNSLNNKFLSSKEDNYFFLVTGHTYGSPQNKSSLHASSSILGSLNKINNYNSKFLVLCGDIIKRTDDVLIKNFLNSFATKLNFPIFNAVGNHDVTDREKYKNYFGNTYFAFKYGSEYFIFLDTELKNKKDKIAQNEYFQKKLKYINSDSSIKNIFIFTHKLIWAQLYSKYDIVFKNVNAMNGYSNQKDLAESIITSVKTFAKNRNLFWVSGDIGVSWSLPIFYHYDTDLHITFIANGIGDTEEDYILKTDINKNDVSFSAINISNYTGELVDIKKYDIPYWENNARNKHLRKKNLLMRIINIMNHRYFILGFSLGFIIISILSISCFFKSSKG